jgi:hypothetical protein
MPPWQSFRRCRSRNSHDFFEKLYRRSNPCLCHAISVPSFAWFSTGSLPPPVGEGMPRPWLFVSQTAAVFVFFPQVGLQTTLRHWEAVAYQPAVPRSSHRTMSPYPFYSWSGPSSRCWDLPFPEHRQGGMVGGGRIGNIEGK